MASYEMDFVTRDTYSSATHTTSPPFYCASLQLLVDVFTDSALRRRRPRGTHSATDLADNRSEHSADSDSVAASDSGAEPLTVDVAHGAAHIGENTASDGLCLVAAHA